MANILTIGGPGSRYQIAGAKPAEFWAGFWHGIIAPITFIVSLFNPQVRLYETHNSGAWYDFGFVLGLAGSFGGSAESRAHHPM